MKTMYPILLLCVGCAAAPTQDPPFDGPTLDEFRCAQHALAVSMADSTWIVAHCAVVDSLFGDSAFKQNLNAAVMDSQRILSYLKEIR